MMRLLLIVLLISVFANCSGDEGPDLTDLYEGNLSFSDQDELTNFFQSGYAEINGNLIIGNRDSTSSITDLSPLESVSRVRGDLTIFFNSKLDDLDGLENLTTIDGHLYIRSNPVLTNTNGLMNLSRVGEFIDISWNDHLLNLQALNSLDSIHGNLSIRKNLNLTELNSFDNLSFIDGRLELEVLGIENVDGLSELNHIGGGLYIGANYDLLNLNGLSNLTHIGSQLSISSNLSLDDFCGLTSLLNSGWSGDYAVAFNAYNPLRQELIEGQCTN